MKNIFKGLVFSLAVLSIVVWSHGTGCVTKAKSESRFQKAVGAEDFAVACIYKKDKAVSEEVKKMQDMFGELDDESRYEHGGVKFVRANLERKKNEELEKKYGATTNPTFILFKDGKQVEGVKLTGFVSKSELRDFIEEHLGADIDEAIARYEEELELRRLKNEANAPQWYGYGGYYGPYGPWGYNDPFDPWYWGRSRWRRRYVRPSVGFGISLGG